MKKNEIIALYKAAFPQSEHEADAGYILPDGTVIDISNTGFSYCHGREFLFSQTLAEWKHNQNDLPMSNRQTADFIMKEIGGVEFTIDNCHLQCVRLPNKPLGAEQRQALRGVISRILERGLIRVEVLDTEFYREFEAKDYDADGVMSELDDHI